MKIVLINVILIDVILILIFASSTCISRTRKTNYIRLFQDKIKTNFP